MLPFEYRSSSRNVMTISFLLFAIAFLVGGFCYGAPVVWLLVVGIPTIGLLWFVLANIRFGMRLDDSTMSWHYGSSESVVRLLDIEHVKITDWSNSYDVDVILKSGVSHRIHSHCYPGVQKLEIALRQFSVEVVNG